MRTVISLLVCLCLTAALPAGAQVELKGRLWAPRLPGSESLIPQTAIRGFAALDGPQNQSLGTRTWEMEPAGWSYMSGPAGRYTMLYSTPAIAMRPILLTNVYTSPGEILDFPLIARYTLGVFDDSSWDPKRASGYFQTFVADGTSVTGVWFKPVHDGVDGEGPAGQDMLVSIHRKGPGTPDTWPRVGPVAVALNVDCGGPKNYSYSVGWDSGEVPTKPGETYAVYIRPRTRGNTFQMYLSKEPVAGTRLYRIAPDGNSWLDSAMWVGISSDSDGLVIPYNKRVHKEYIELAGFSRKWSQSYVARGRSLAGVILYAAASGVQPTMNRQRVLVRVREGGPGGPVVGVVKAATGNATYTGDASWGTFGTAYSPGEVLLTPGTTYTIEFETMENVESLRGWLNFKLQQNDERPGFNPYKKAPQDDYPRGTAYKEGRPVDFDLDMQVLEYLSVPADWDKAVEGPNLLQNGTMSMGTVSSGPEDPGRPLGWTAFDIDPQTRQFYLADPNEPRNRILRVLGGGPYGKNPDGGGNRTADGGFVQRVEGLDPSHTYRISGKVRCSWPVDMKHQQYVGWDPTGQTDDPQAPTIVWECMPSLTGVWNSWLSPPIRPQSGSISIWLRGCTTLPDDYPFKADFDDFALRRVARGIPQSR